MVQIGIIYSVQDMVDCRNRDAQYVNTNHTESNWNKTRTIDKDRYNRQELKPQPQLDTRTSAHQIGQEQFRNTRRKALTKSNFTGNAPIGKCSRKTLYICDKHPNKYTTNYSISIIPKHKIFQNKNYFRTEKETQTRVSQDFIWILIRLMSRSTCRLTS